MSVLGVQTVGRAGRCAQGLIWQIDTTSEVGAWGDVGEVMRAPSRTDLPRLRPAPSAAAQFPRAAVHKNTNAVPFSQLAKQISTWRISLRSLEPKGKYPKSRVRAPEVSGEMSLLLRAVHILLDLVVFTGLKHSLVFL